jgi:hypothetical protein
MILETVTKKKDFSMIGASDLGGLREFLAHLTPYPWTPKQVRNIKSQADLIFISKSPEVVEFLLDYINWLLKERNQLLEAKDAEMETKQGS